MSSRRLEWALCLCLCLCALFLGRFWLGGRPAALGQQQTWQAARQLVQSTAGGCRVKLAIDGDTLLVNLRAEREVSGLMVLTFVAQDPLMLGKPFHVPEGGDVTEKYPIDVGLLDVPEDRHHETGYFRLEFYEQTDEEPDGMVFVGAFLVVRRR